MVAIYLCASIILGLTLSCPAATSGSLIYLLANKSLSQIATQQQRSDNTANAMQDRLPINAVSVDTPAGGAKMAITPQQLSDFMMRDGIRRNLSKVIVSRSPKIPLSANTETDSMQDDTDVGFEGQDQYLDEEEASGDENLSRLLDVHLSMFPLFNPLGLGGQAGGSNAAQPSKIAAGAGTGSGGVAPLPGMPSRPQMVGTLRRAMSAPIRWGR